MTRHTIPGGWYVDARPDGAWACVLYQEARVRTHAGDVPFPLDGGRPLFLRVPDDGPFRIGAINQRTDDAIEWVFGSWLSHGKACGPSGVIYDGAGVLRTADCARDGSQGYRFVDAFGRLVTGDATFAPADNIDLYEWTDADGLRFGQGPDDGLFMHRNGRYHILEPAGVPVRNVRVHRRGDDVAVAYVVLSRPSVIVWATVDELAALPSVASPRAPKPYLPIVPVNRPLWFGFFVFGNGRGVPGNCSLPVFLGQTRATVVDGHGRAIYRYVAGVPDGDLAAVNQAVREERGTVPVLAYWTRGAQQVGVPDADVVGVEAYLGRDESDEAFITRVSAACARVKRAVLIANCYTSNTNNTSDLRRVPPLIACLAQANRNVEGVLVFSAGDGRSTGWDDHHEVHADWLAFEQGITAEPSLPTPKPPPKPKPQPQVPEKPRVSDKLLPNQSLTTFQALVSASGQWRCEVQGDHNLVISSTAGVVSWASHVAADTITMQGDGNLVASLHGVWAWHSGTMGHPGAWAFLSDDGRLIVFSSSGQALWYADSGLVEQPPAPVPTEPSTGPLPPIVRLAITGRTVNREPRGVTSFKLLHHFIYDRPAYERCVADVVRQGFDCVRVLASCVHMFRLSPLDARAHLSAFMHDLQARGLYGWIVACADTKAWPSEWGDWRQHAEQVARQIEGCDNAIFEIANEVDHDTQDDAVAAEADTLFARIAPTCVGTCGAPLDDEAKTPAGAFATRHLSRSRDPWNMVRRVRELEMLSGDLRKPVFSGEPIGAGEHDEPGRRCANPDIFLTMGGLARIFNAPTVFHCEDGLSSTPLRPVQAACAAAFLEGTRIVPDDVRLVFKNATWADSPVKSFDTTAAVRAYSGIHGAHGVLCVLGITGDPRIELQHGWHITETVHDRPQVKVYRIQQG